MHLKIKGFKGNNSFLSNFHLCEVMYDGIVYPSSEAAFHAAKTLSLAARLQIQAASTPGRAKRLGRLVKLRPGWNKMRRDVMEQINRNKFKEGSHLAQMLMRTGTATLIEENTWHDNFWGDCKCGRPECSEKGKNHLGKILMKIRYDLLTN